MLDYELKYFGFLGARLDYATEILRQGRLLLWSVISQAQKARWWGCSDAGAINITTANNFSVQPDSPFLLSICNTIRECAINLTHKSVASTNAIWCQSLQLKWTPTIISQLHCYWFFQSIF